MINNDEHFDIKANIRMRWGQIQAFWLLGFASKSTHLPLEWPLSKNVSASEWAAEPKEFINKAVSLGSTYDSEQQWRMWAD